MAKRNKNQKSFSSKTAGTVSGTTQTRESKSMSPIDIALLALTAAGHPVDDLPDLRGMVRGAPCILHPRVRLRHRPEQSLGHFARIAHRLLGFAHLYIDGSPGLARTKKTWQLTAAGIRCCLRVCHQCLFDRYLSSGNRGDLSLLSGVVCHHDHPHGPDDRSATS